ncbi:DUF1961 family protein [Caldalkalibacillus salinus]|uniref:DUF1961 family protein n=1 Tax=Caldalkalibacillus salinus TaxID=2803787 RepID=UPI001920C18D|nr:DUF1961 family protein [Caldalkalibacillus salinus]
MPDHLCRDRSLIYANKLASAKDVRDFTMEGKGVISFPQGRLRMENSLNAQEGQKANFVYWLNQDFPSDLCVEWEFWPIREPGLCILFFAAIGQNGEDLFDSTLQKRTGEYAQYHSGDIHTYHVSYFRRKYTEERAFQTVNLRKSRGFHLVCQGADPMPSVSDATPPYHMKLYKYEGHIQFFINDLILFDWTDDGQTYGPILKGGKIGFRQMAPLIGEYANLRVYEL